MQDKIKDILDQVRTRLQEDGGDLELVKVEGKTVSVRLKGACGSCPHAMATLKGFVEQVLKEHVDQDIVVERIN
ncbi:MAG TPA: NifU family protein [Lentisphaeria bacterium]|nr:NifU family protein [Lentisphaerota bacterium]OQC13595.1 MAG: Fe/S biogenesis protein NfuA [Lentisphaerae bacterium ADurb.Bin082]HQC53241.1 NifU family protein [Lentisphaeria bacterium]HQL87365.1 NifU family protein [Lentisphaeria bacterium]